MNVEDRAYIIDLLVEMIWRIENKNQPQTGLDKKLEHNALILHKMRLKEFRGEDC